MGRDRNGMGAARDFEMRLGSATDANGVVAIADEAREFRDRWRTGIRRHALPLLQQAIRGGGGGRALLWEEFDLEARTVRQQAVRLDPPVVRFRLTPDEEAIEVDVGAGSGRRPRLPIALDGGVRGSGDIHLGWRMTRPVLRWRYRGQGVERRIEVEWSIPGFPAEWIDVLRRQEACGPLACTIDGTLSLALELTRSDTFTFAGQLSFRDGDPVPVRTFSLELPLAWSSSEGGDAGGRLETRIAAQVETLDFYAVVDGRPTRFVADEELGERFSVTVVTPQDAVLAQTLPAGTWNAVPFPLIAVPGAPYRDASEAWRCDWLLTPAERGHWDEVWPGEDHPPLAFGPGTSDRRITRIASRGARIGWSVRRPAPGRETDGGDGSGALASGLLYVVRPELTPLGQGPEALRLELASYDYTPTVEAQSDGIREYFAVDGESELPAERLVLAPDRWKVRDEAGSEVPAETYGALSGKVRWRRPGGMAGDAPGTPAAWAAGSGPVLVAQETPSTLARWGALYVPAEADGRPPRLDGAFWHILHEVEPVRAEEGEGVVLRAGEGIPALWMDLCGFFARFDRRAIGFRNLLGASQPVIAWTTTPGLPLFPAPGERLLRALAPLYAVRAEGTGIRIQPGSPRPTLRIGTGVAGEDAPEAAVVPEMGTLVRAVLAPGDEVPDELPPVLLLPWRGAPGEGVLWLAVEPLAPAGQGALPGHLLSWSRRLGWRFRGYYAAAGQRVQLGSVRYAEASPPRRRDPFVPVWLEESRRGFLLTLREGQPTEWSGDTPREISERVTGARLGEWLATGLSDDHIPAELQGYRPLRRAGKGGALVVEFVPAREVVRRQLPLRVWRPESAEALAAWEAAGTLDVLDEAYDAPRAEARPTLALPPAPPPPEPRVSPAPPAALAPPAARAPEPDVPAPDAGGAPEVIEFDLGEEKEEP